MNDSTKPAKRGIHPFFDVFNLRFVSKRLFIDFFWLLHIAFAIGVAWVWKLWLFDYDSWGSGPQVDVMDGTPFRLHPWDAFGADQETLSQYTPLPGDFESVPSILWVLMPVTVAWIFYLLCLPAIGRRFAKLMRGSTIKGLCALLGCEFAAISMLYLSLPWITFQVLPRFDVNRYVVEGIIENGIRPYRIRHFLMRGALSSSSMLVRINAYTVLRWDDSQTYAAQLRSNLEHGGLNERIALLSATIDSSELLFSEQFQAARLIEILEKYRSDPRIARLVLLHLAAFPEGEFLLAGHLSLIEESIRNWGGPHTVKAGAIMELMRLNGALDPVDYLIKAKFLPKDILDGGSHESWMDPAIPLAICLAGKSIEATDHKTIEFLFQYFSEDISRKYAGVVFTQFMDYEPELRRQFYALFADWICDPKLTNLESKTIYLWQLLATNSLPSFEHDDDYYATIEAIRDCGIMNQQKGRLDHYLPDCPATTFGELMECHLAQRLESIVQKEDQ